MLAIKFKRVGKKHQATFRLVVTERRSKLNGRFVDDLGWMNPHTDTFDVKEKETKHWLSVGAQPTASVHNLLVKAGLVEGPKIPVHNVPKKKEEPEKPASAKATADKKEAVPAEEVNPADPAPVEVKEEEKKEEVPVPAPVPEEEAS
ncbi:MAG: Ribosomal protein S14 [Candidatus Jorgensenbacteria bacterium GW2011_GWA2_45_13]|uniref:Small ribosomal subunit protein bS16 n=1 Tax=Candidatus Jorgensenbacteria bacterium GW2011_GWA2_45_13 TaxID=1618662 RepID=A0A0G1L589_9BACT|nr:MAG: Ribosomal protein S14 [Candidatus Jorgensenbacteria bacterium GW2011_GWA2_45_13]